MKTNLIISALILIAGAAAAQAQNMSAMQNNNPAGSSTWFNPDPNGLYRGNEFSLDAFGAATFDSRRHDDYYRRHDRDDSHEGGGGGLEYFFCRYAGVEAESFAVANDRNTDSAVGGNLILRWPIGSTGFAPYVLGGGGEEWTHRSEGYGDGGGGVEYRWTRCMGIFADGRFVVPASTRNYGMVRLGVRFIF